MMSQQDTSTKGRLAMRLKDEGENCNCPNGQYIGLFSVERLLEPAVRCSAAGTVQGGTGDGQCALM